MFAVDLIGLRRSRLILPLWIVFQLKHPDYNSKYFPEPEEFRPSRWYGTADNDMTMFSLGPRTCESLHSLLLQKHPEGSI
ncbi:hypothetical protein B0H14DRAFT_2801526 [Mycena olivaceomarginata]|nr:hypothetical protein B0H14DRAFT_2801526 [Mycena olivaceomarginata]